jgi:hypothetical protein
MAQAPFGQSKRVYTWVAFVFLAIAIPSGWYLVNGIRDLTEGLIRFSAPGSAQITIDEPGHYNLFHEYRSSFGGRVVNGPAVLSNLTITMLGPKGVSPAVEGSSGNFNYSLGSSAGYSIGSIQIEEPGVYQMESRYTGTPGGDVVLALGREKGRSTLQTVAGFLGLFGAAAVAFIVWLVIFLVRRSRARSAAYLQGGTS